MKRRFSVQLEIEVNNKGNLISEVFHKHNYARKPYTKITIEDAIQLALENASYYIDVQKTTIHLLPLE